MIYVLYVLHIFVCLFLILVVLLQQGKGADLSVFGGGSTQTAFGARGAATLLHKLTVVSFVVFILTTMAIALVQGAGEGGGGSVMSEVERERAEEPSQETAPATSEEQAPATTEETAPAGTEEAVPDSPDRPSPESAPQTPDAAEGEGPADGR